MSAPVLAYYGDDFTGSADVMEVLQWHGLRTVLFLSPPTTKQLARFTDLQAFGIAGSSRSMTTGDMDQHLPNMFRQLGSSGAPIVHYKTCSTFDSSPQIGSIGRAIELGRQVLGDDPVPVLIAAPRLGRYQAFGNLFARSGLDSQPYRLDRHPTMSRHPITPMQEADLREVLAAQTSLHVELINVLTLESLTPSQLGHQVLSSGADIVLFDAVNELHVSKVGAAIASLHAQERCRFVVGSSGIEYAMAAAWTESTGPAVANGPASFGSGSPVPRFAGVDQLLVFTGTCSPVNGRQIACAEQHGFCSIAIDTPRLVDEALSPGECDRVIAQVVRSLDAGANVIAHTSRGPDDPRVMATYQAMRSRGLNELQVKLSSSAGIAKPLGSMLNQILAARPLRRVGVAGGDTSGMIARELGVEALEAIAPVAPGSPLCRVHAAHELDGAEFIFKGGQVGRDDVWLTMLHGTDDAARIK